MTTRVLIVNYGPEVVEVDTCSTPEVRMDPAVVYSTVTMFPVSSKEFLVYPGQKIQVREKVTVS